VTFGLNKLGLNKAAHTWRLLSSGRESIYDVGLNCWGGGSESKSDEAENKEGSDEHGRSYLM
jgi:hypothetical protein